MAPTLAPDRHLRTDHLKPNLKGRTVRGGAVTLVAQFLKLLAQVGATAVLARLLTPDDFGLVVMVTAVTGFLALFKDLGLSMATIQREELDRAQVSALFWINVGVSVLIALVTAALAPLIARFYGEPQLAAFTIVLACGFLLAGATVQHQALLRRQMRFGRLAVLEVGSLVCGAIVGVLCAFAGHGPWSIVWMHFGTAAAMCVGAWLLCPWRPGRPAPWQRVKALVGFGANLTGFGIVNYWARHSDKIMLGRVFGRHITGLYGEAYKWMLLPLAQVNAPMTSVAVPALSRLANEPERYRSAYLRLYEKVALLTMPGVVFMIGTADWLIHVLLGPQWHSAALIFTLLGITALHQPLTASAGWLFVTQDRTRDQFKWGIFGSALIVASFLCGLPWGAVGVAAAYGLSGPLIRMPLLFWWVGRKGPVRTRDFYAAAGPVAVACGCALSAMGLFRWLVPEASPWIGLVSGFVITFGVVLVALAAQPNGRKVLRDTKYAFKLLK